MLIIGAILLYDIKYPQATSEGMKGFILQYAAVSFIITNNL